MGSDPLEIENLLLGVAAKVGDLHTFDRVRLSPDGRSLTADADADLGSPCRFEVVDDDQPGRLRIGFATDDAAMARRLRDAITTGGEGFEQRLTAALQDHGYQGRLAAELRDHGERGLSAYSYLTPPAGENLAAQAMVDRVADVLLGYRGCVARLME